MRDFQDRTDAGQRLALELQGYAERLDVVVLALPRGGVVVGYEIATQLELPLDVLVVRKLGVPGQRELAMGAIASGGVLFVDRSITTELEISDQQFDAVLEAERAELARREELFRGTCREIDVRDRSVILVDDGIATGATMRAALEGLRRRAPAEIIIAVPVASRVACSVFERLVDDFICLVQPIHLYAIGLWYRDFSQTSDADVRHLLEAAARALDDHNSDSPPHTSAPAPP